MNIPNFFRLKNRPEPGAAATRSSSGARDGRPAEASRRSRMLGLVAVLAAVTLSRCASLAPGAEPLVVRTEQTLSASDALYDSAMSVYFAKASSLSASTVSVLEKVRVGFDPAYKAVQGALTFYKLNRGSPDPTVRAQAEASLVNAKDALAELLNTAVPYVAGAKPVPLEPQKAKVP